MLFWKEPYVRNQNFVNSYNPKLDTIGFRTYLFEVPRL